MNPRLNRTGSTPRATAGTIIVTCRECVDKRRIARAALAGGKGVQV